MVLYSEQGEFLAACAVPMYAHTLFIDSLFLTSSSQRVCPISNSHCVLYALLCSFARSWPRALTLLGRPASSSPVLSCSSSPPSARRDTDTSNVFLTSLTSDDGRADDRLSVRVSCGTQAASSSPLSPRPRTSPAATASKAPNAAVAVAADAAAGAVASFGASGRHYRDLFPPHTPRSLQTSGAGSSTSSSGTGGDALQTAFAAV